jgi:DNA-binding MarR family transcriptional regulator
MRQRRAHTPEVRSLNEREVDAAFELRATIRRFLRRSEQLTRAAGLTPERYELLLAVSVLASVGTADGPTVADLAETLELAQSSTTQLVRRAEDSGLITRTVATHDARVRYVRLTPEGERRLTDALTALRSERAYLGEVSRRLSE